MLRFHFLNCGNQFRYLFQIFKHLRQLAFGNIPNYIKVNTEIMVYSQYNSFFRKIKLTYNSSVAKLKVDTSFAFQLALVMS